MKGTKLHSVPGSDIWYGGGGSENSDPTQHSSVGGGKTALKNDVLACTLFAAAGTSVNRAKKQTTDFSLTQRRAPIHFQLKVNLFSETLIIVCLWVLNSESHLLLLLGY